MKNLYRFLALILLFSSGLAQVDPLPDKDENRTVAGVMGRAIVSGEVEQRMKDMGPDIRKQYPNIKESDLFWLARRDVAHHVLLVETARLYIDDLQDEEVVRYWNAYYNEDEQKVRDNIKTFRNNFLLRQYLDCRMGLSNRLKGVSPDLAEFIRVTPKEMKDAYRSYKDQPLAEPEIEVVQYLFPDSRFPSSGRESTLAECIGKLKAQAPDKAKLEALAAQWPGCLFIAGKHDSFQPEIADFARNAAVGDVSKPITLDRGAVVAYVLTRVEEKKQGFEEFQHGYMRKLRTDKIQWVTDFIVNNLIQQADYFPRDLFIHPEQAQAKEK